MVEQKRLKYPLEVVVEEFRAHGFQIVGPYVDTNTPVEVLCPNGHRSAVRRTNFKKTKFKCRHCAKNAPRTHEDVVAEFESHGYTVIGSYQNCHTALEVVCPEGHLTKMVFATLRESSKRRKRNGCKVCAGVVLKTQPEVEKIFAARGFILHSEYDGVFSRLSIECPKGHTWETSLHSFNKTKNGCPFCTGVRIGDDERESVRLALRMRIRINQMLKRRKHPKPYKLETFPSIRAREIIATLGSRPEGCALDHIVPVSFFDHRSLDEVYACWAIANLRWIPTQENFLRKNRLTHEEVAQFSEEQLEILRIASFKPEKFNRY